MLLDTYTCMRTLRYEYIITVLKLRQSIVVQCGMKKLFSSISLRY